MPTLTIQAALALIAAGGCVPPATAPVMVGLAQHESRLNPLAIHDNATGRAYAPVALEAAIQLATGLRAQGHDLDLGIAQVNVRNLGWTGLTIAAAFDPCASFRAGLKILFAKYNGAPPEAVRVAYAASVMAAVPSAVNQPAPCPPSDPDGWHIAVQPSGCLKPCQDADGWHVSTLTTGCEPTQPTTDKRGPDDKN